AGLAVDRLTSNGAWRLFGERQIDRLHFEQPLVLLDQGILGLDQDLLERSLIEILKRRHDWEAANEFRDQAIFQQVLRLDFPEDLTLLAILRRHHFGSKADRGRPPSRRNDLLKPGESAAADEQDVRRIDLQEFLLRVLAAALRGYGSDGAFHDF